MGTGACAADGNHDEQSALQHVLKSDEKDQEEVELDEANKVEAEWGWRPTWSHGKTLCGSYKNNEERHVNSDGQVMSIPFGENWGNACNSCLGWMKKKSTALKGKKEKWCCKTYALGVFIES